MITPKKKKRNLFAKEQHYSVAIMAMVIVLVTLTICVTIGYVVSSSRDFRQAQENIVTQLKNNLEYQLEEHEELASSIMLGVSNTISRSEASEEDEYQEFREASTQLSAYLGRGMISDIDLYIPDSKMYSVQRDLFFPLKDLTEEEDYAHCLEPGFHWLSGHWIRSGTTGIDEPAVTCALTTRSQSKYSELAGVLLLHLEVEDLYATIGSVSDDENEVFVVDKSGQMVIYSDSRNPDALTLDAKELKLITSSALGSGTVNSHLLAYALLDSVDWYVVVRMPQYLFSQFSFAGSLIFVIMWLVTSASVMLGAVILSQNIVVIDTIRTMQNLLSSEPSDVEEPVLELPQMPVLFSNKQLHREIENILQAVLKTVEKQYQDRIEMADYQMQSLQEQIKPHFLYNTLDIINWMILDGNVKESMHMINILSKYLRLSINRGANVVSLRQEIELVQTYLDILSVRYADTFQVIYELEEETLNDLLPRLSLQPAVENALLHGLLPSNKPEKVLFIRSWRENGFLHVDIEDNGCGIPPERLAFLQEKEPSHDSAEKKGYGLRNVRRRIRLFGGKNADLEINSREGFGTCVSITLPSKTE